jgi:exodeoxyribonuclease X
MINVDVFDTETADIDGGICDLAIARIDENFDVVWAIESMIDPERPISPSAMGVHHITNEMVANEPTLAEFVEIHGNPFNRDGLVVGGHNVAFDCRAAAALMPPKYRKLCTLKLARAIWPDLPDHKLQTLRYQFGLEAGAAHRAMGDVITSVSLIRHINRVTGWSLADMIDECRKPISFETKLKFGKHKGVKLKDLPKSYISWALREMENLDPDLREAFEALA